MRKMAIVMIWLTNIHKHQNKHRRFPSLCDQRRLKNVQQNNYLFLNDDKKYKERKKLVGLGLLKVMLLKLDARF